MTDAKSEHYLNEDLKKAALAAESLLKSWKDEIADDDDLAEDLIEGETDLKELAAKVLNQFNRDGELIAGIGERESALKIRKARLKARQARLKAMLGIALTITGRKSLELPEATISKRKGTRKLEVTEESEIPSQYFKKQDPVLDNAGLTAAIKALEAQHEAAVEAARVTGKEPPEFEPIPGCQLTTGLPSVSIRNK